MEEKPIHQSSMSDKPLFSGLNLAGLAEELIKSVPFHKAGQENNSEVSTINRNPGGDVKSESQRVQTMFGGLNLVEAFEALRSRAEFSLPKRPTNVKSMPEKPPSPEILLSKICTADVIASLIKVKKTSG